MLDKSRLELHLDTFYEENRLLKNHEWIFKRLYQDPKWSLTIPGEDRNQQITSQWSAVEFKIGIQLIK